MLLNHTHTQKHTQTHTHTHWCECSVHKAPRTPESPPSRRDSITFDDDVLGKVRELNSSWDLNCTPTLTHSCTHSHAALSAFLCESNGKLPDISRGGRRRSTKRLTRGSFTIPKPFKVAQVPLLCVRVCVCASHSLTPSLTHSFTHSFTHSRTHALTVDFAHPRRPPPLCVDECSDECHSERKNF